MRQMPDSLGGGAMTKRTRPVMICIVLALILIAIVSGIVSSKKPFHCHDVSHRTYYVANPYCPKCRDRDGIATHECSNPDGENIYCHVCGKRTDN